MFVFPLQQHEAVNVAEEKLSALKKVYADVLLNNAKESAAQILVSESKALCYQRNLAVTKEEAIQILVRLKGLMETKVTEAEYVSSSQLKRIKQLEAQLTESQNTIKILRMELEKMTNELLTIKEKSENKSDRHSAEIAPHCEGPCKENEMVIPDSMPSSLGSDSGYEAISENCIQPDSFQQFSPNICNVSRDMSSIMVVRGSELLRNGCTHRIQASEQSSPEGDADEKSSKLPLALHRNDLNRNVCSIVHESPVTCYKIPDGLKDRAFKNKSEDWQPIRLFRRLRNCRSKYATRKDCFHSALESSKSSESAKKCSVEDLLAHSSPRLVKCEYDEQGDETSFAAVKRNAQGNSIKLVEAVQDTNNKLTTEKVVVYPIKSSLKNPETNGIPRAFGSQIVKYTFQRRRLKRPLNTSEDVSSEKMETNKKIKIVNMTNCSAEAKNLDPIFESSQERCGIAQVAHQV